ncbi:hypothetical protein SEA_PYTHEAS_61 [Gordonia phage Pytheas]|nr:hypothetical protein SEA_JABLANSKI_61 [Gordonia Phage Jablanski]UYL88089.1 hypothetical protein SEA_PYTHEAS_61 [Gordonia phage Pytheas]
MSSVAPAPIPIRRAEGDFPPDRPTTFTDDYGRSQVLVPIEDLQRETAEIRRWRNDISGALGVRPGELNLTLAGAVEKIGDLKRAEAAKGRLADRIERLDHSVDVWKARHDRLHDAVLRSNVAIHIAGGYDHSPMTLYAGPDHVTPLREALAEREQAQARIADLERRPAYNSGGHLAGLSGPAELLVARNACSVVDEVLGRRDGESSHNAARRVIAERDRAQAVDHTDPDQVRRAAGVIEGLGMDEEDLCPELRRVSARWLRQRAQQLETANPMVPGP